MKLEDLPTLEVALKRRDDLSALRAKYDATGAWVLFSQESFEPGFVAKIKEECIAEIDRATAEINELIASLGVEEPK